MNKRSALLADSRRLSISVAARLAAYAACGAIFACGRLPGGASALGSSLVCAVSGAPSLVACTLGALFGAVVSHSPAAAAVCAGCAVLRYLLCLLLSDDERGGTSLGERLRSVAFDESVWARMLLAAAGALICGGLELLKCDYSVAYLASTAAAGAVSPALVYLYGEMEASTSDELSRRAASIAVCASFVLGSANILPFVDLSLPTAFGMTMCAVRRRGAMWGLFLGVVLGIFCPTEASLVLALAALACAPIMRHAPAAAVSCAFIASCTWLLYSNGLSAMSSFIPKLAVSAAITAAVCTSISHAPAASAAKGESTHSAVQPIESELCRRLHSLSSGFASLSEVLNRLSEHSVCPDDAQLEQLCRDSLEEYCSKCGMRSDCFEHGQSPAESLCSRMVLALKSDGRVSAALVSRELASRCFNMSMIIDGVNAAFARLVSEARLYDRTAVVAADYELTARVLDEAAAASAEHAACDTALGEKLKRALAASSLYADSLCVFTGRQLRAVAVGVDIKRCRAREREIVRAASRVLGRHIASPEFSVDGSVITMTLSAAPALSVACGRASIASSAVRRAPCERDESTLLSAVGDRRGVGKLSSADCGDVINAFETDDGRFFMMISDGMGTGREAALSSGICAVFVERLLRAGASMDTSLKLLNSLLRARGDECSATIDLLELDLISGRVRLVKSGAAPSFVVRDGRLFRLQSKTVPIGILRALDAELINFEAVAGDRIIMLSDGVARSFEDCPWLYELLGGELTQIADADGIARTILRRAIENGASDDITAGVILLEGIGSEDAELKGKELDDIERA